MTNITFTDEDLTQLSSFLAEDDQDNLLPQDLRSINLAVLVDIPPEHFLILDHSDVGTLDNLGAPIPPLSPIFIDDAIETTLAAAAAISIFTAVHAGDSPYVW